jgi:ribosomal protein L19E
VRILQWLDRYRPAVFRELSDDDRRRFQGSFRQARHRKGAIERARARAWRGGPQVGVRLPVTGTEDERYGHIRVEALIRDVVIPLVECGAITPNVYAQLYQKLRGHFAQQCHQLQRAWWMYRATIEEQEEECDESK